MTVLYTPPEKEMLSSLCATSGIECIYRSMEECYEFRNIKTTSDPSVALNFKKQPITAQQCTGDEWFHGDVV